jgi:GWxTD domain-containing protein
VFRHALVAVALTAAWAPVTRAAGFDLTDVPPTLPVERPRFLADGGSRLGPNGPEVLLAFEVPYSELFFRPVGSRRRSRFDLILLLRDGKRQVGGDLFSETIEVLDRHDTRDPAARARRILPVRVKPGRYRAEVILRETAAGRQSQVSWDLQVPDYAALPLSLSSLWVSDGTAAEGDSVALPPAGWLLRRRYGEPLGPLVVSGEIYRGDGGSDSTRVTWRIVGSRGEEIQRGETRRPAGARVPFRLHPEFSSLWLGSYVLEVLAEAGGHDARRRLSFQTDATAGAFEADSRQSLELIELIATPDEIRELRDTPAVMRKEAWNRFWKRRDPTPGTPENEFRDEFFARVRYVDEHFSVLGPGWRSDRGRVYIQYGPPDEIESNPMNVDSPAYEIWTYVSQGRRFIFVDYDGYGRYELYQPGRL